MGCEMQLYNVLNNGDLQEIKSDKPIKEHLRSNSVFIIVSDEKKKIWIWKGANAPVRQKFISARAATQIREQRGLTYKVSSEDEGDESDEFLISIGEKPKPRVEVKKPPIKHKVSEVKQATQTQIKTPQTISSVAVQKTTQNFTTSQTESKKPSIASVTAVNHEDIIKKLDSIPVPHGFERELVIIGNEIYTVTEQTIRFLGKKRIKKKLEKAPLGTVPEGVFLAEEYTPRVIVDNGSVMAIEFLKQTEAVELPDETVSSIKDEMKYHLSDLVDFFKIEIKDESKKK
ncbi:MAG: hypothetical protein ACTSYR_00595 [Candidatus Odinarchaeia archaeon]